MFLKKQTNKRITIWFNISDTGMCLEDRVDAFEVIYSAVFIAALFIIAKGWKQPKYLSMAGWLTRSNLGKTYKRKLSVLKRDEISIRFAIWNPRGHYTKRNNPDTKLQRNSIVLL